MLSRIHPTAVIDPRAELADDVVIGPLAVIEGAVRIGANSEIQAHAQLIGPLTLGDNNLVGRNAILGDEPQHLSATGAGADVVIGNQNTFRENVTVHRGSAPGKVTCIGNNNLFMVGSHVGHDCTIGNNCIFANGALLGGHVTVEDMAYISGNSAVHQRMRIGRLAMLSGTSAVSLDLPPFIIAQYFNIVCGVNVVGMRRAGYARAEIDGVRQAYRMLFLRGDLVPTALNAIEEKLGHLSAVTELVNFVRTSNHGICTCTGRTARNAA